MDDNSSNNACYYINSYIISYKICSSRKPQKSKKFDEFVMSILYKFLPNEAIPSFTLYRYTLKSNCDLENALNNFLIHFGFRIAFKSSEQNDPGVSRSP